MIKHTARIHQMSLREEQDLACDGPNGYARLCALRLEGFKEHVAQMAVPKVLLDWRSSMIELHGPLVQVNWIEMPWLEALMVVRYGEAIYTVNHERHSGPEDVDGFDVFWPASFSDKDIKRAMEWHAGVTPRVVRYLPKPEQVLANPEE